MKFILLHLLIFINCFYVFTKDTDCTDLVPEEASLLVFSTLGGGLTAIDPPSGEIRWIIPDEPAKKVTNQGDITFPQYLPDPRDGSIYQLGNMGDLKKLPYSIPQLVANAPCRSSDGILYSGKKTDVWFLIDPITGKCEKLIDFQSIEKTNTTESITWATSRSIYLGRTQYTVLMYDSRSKTKDMKPWNITFYDYTSHSMTSKIYDDYEYIHLAGSSSGCLITLNRQSGKLLWQKTLSSPVIAAFVLSPDGLLNAPLTTVSDETLKYIIEEAEDGSINKIKLFKSLYVGEHSYGLYAILSLTDKNTVIITSNPTSKLIEGKGPTQSIYEQERKLLNLNNLFPNQKNAIVYGHYDIPKAVKEMEFESTTATSKKPIYVQQLTVVDNNFDIEKLKEHFISEDQIVNEDNMNYHKTDNDQNITNKIVAKNNLIDDKLISILSDIWFAHKIGYIQTIMIISTLIIFAMFLLYKWNSFRKFHQNSQWNSKIMATTTTSNNTETYQKMLDLGNGRIQIGKIIFNCNEVLGKGCEGTFVFKGYFERRNVAVKRLLPECFSFADREVALLSESDAHENVVRYFCTERDRQFRYIAVELCIATLQDYTVGEKSEDLRKYIEVWDVLRQATNGLAHLHSLNIVHRDIKPQNVLLSAPDSKSRVRVMISDFGLCKKLTHDRISFSTQSGITGTEGWIAPEIIIGEQTTTAVDIFSLGCLFYYVLTNGDHAFGESLRRQSNILSNEYNLEQLFLNGNASQLILVEQLITDMIQRNPQKRPPARAVYGHPVFWNEEKILSFFQDVSDRIEKIIRDIEPLKTLEDNCNYVIKDDWHINIDTVITDDLKRYRGYTGNSIRDLLRAIRNKKHHYHELPHEAQQILGNIPQEFTNYWIKKFPYLLSYSYHVFKMCSFENPFKLYYDDSYKFSSPHVLSEKIPSDLCQLQCIKQLNANSNSNNNNNNNNSKVHRKKSNNYFNSNVSNNQKENQNNINANKYNKFNKNRNKFLRRNIIWTKPENVDHPVVNKICD